jgi:hypothetical protein
MNGRCRTTYTWNVRVNLQAFSYKKLCTMTPLQILCSFQVSWDMEVMLILTF